MIIDFYTVFEEQVNKLSSKGILPAKGKYFYLKRMRHSIHICSGTVDEIKHMIVEQLPKNHMFPTLRSN